MKTALKHTGILDFYKFTIASPLICTGYQTHTEAQWEKEPAVDHAWPHVGLQHARFAHVIQEVEKDVSSFGTPKSGHWVYWKCKTVLDSSSYGKKRVRG